MKPTVSIGLTSRQIANEFQGQPQAMPSKAVTLADERPAPLLQI